MDVVPGALHQLCVPVLQASVHCCTRLIYASLHHIAITSELMVYASSVYVMFDALLLIA